MICFCGRPARARALCATHYKQAQRIRAARVGDPARRLVIHQGLPGVVVRCPAATTINALLTWDAAHRRAA